MSRRDGDIFERRYRRAASSTKQKRKDEELHFQCGVVVDIYL